MTRQSIALIVILAAVLVPLVGLLVVESQLRERLSRRPEVGVVFPALPGTGEEQPVLEATGKRQVVVFAKSGCGNCDRTITTLARLAVDQQLGLTVIVAGLAAAEARNEEELVFSVIPDPDGAVSRRFGVVRVPLVFVLDGELRVQAAFTGYRPEAIWASELSG